MIFVNILQGRSWLRRTKEVRTERQVCEIINKERRKGRRFNDGIERGEWKEYFMELLGRVEVKVV